MDYLALLPHAPPMRLIEEVVELVPGERSHCRRVTHADDFYFNGHFPGHPVIPAVVLVELLAQAGGLAAGAPDSDLAPGLRGLRVAALGPFKFPAAAGPGVLLDVFARVVGRIGRMYKIEGEVTGDGLLLASGSVTLAG
jgi:3-hydroxyacyl-[acyl-carrier-protein] dehydratase